MLHEVAKPPIQLASRISARLKVMAGLDISERRKPQDGRIKMRVSKNKSIDFRVNTLPTLWGEKIVMRILDSSSAQMGIDALGYEEDQKELYLAALKQPPVSYTHLDVYKRQVLDQAQPGEPGAIALDTPAPAGELLQRKGQQQHQERHVSSLESVNPAR